MERRFRTSTADGAVVEFGLVRHATLAKLASGPAALRGRL